MPQGVKTKNPSGAPFTSSVMRRSYHSGVVGRGSSEKRYTHAIPRDQAEDLLGVHRLRGRLQLQPSNRVPLFLGQPDSVNAESP